MSPDLTLYMTSQINLHRQYCLPVLAHMEPLCIEKPPHAQFKNRALINLNTQTNKEGRVHFKV